MQKFRMILLPGLHGTEELFEPFLNCAPRDFEFEVISFSTDKILSYSALVEQVGKHFKEPIPTILLGESFSGPLALMVAARAPRGLIGVILVATFVLPPAPPFLRFLPWNLIFCLSVPIYSIRMFLANSKNAAILKKSEAVLKRISPHVLADRVRSTLNVNAVEALRSCRVPVLYLTARHDHVVRRKSLREILSLRPDVTVGNVEAPHFLLQYAPVQAWEAIIPFTNKCLSHD